MYEFPSSKKSSQIFAFERNRNTFIILITLVESVHDPQILLLVLRTYQFKNLFPDELVIPINKDLNGVIFAVVKCRIDDIVRGVCVHFVFNISHSFPWKI